MYEGEVLNGVRQGSGKLTLLDGSVLEGFFNDGTISGMWENSLRKAIDSTKIAYPDGEIVCSMDKKAFKGWQRQAIRDLLEELGVPLLKRSEIIG